MAELTIELLAELIHASSTRIVLVTTGGGSLAISDLLTVGGASRTVLEAAVPYSAGALHAWLGEKPEQYCSSATARQMAMAALRRAQAYDTPDANLAGIACTASLASDRPKRGLHRAHLALQTRAVTSTISLTLEKGKRTRAEEERVVAGLILNLLAEAAGLAERLSLPLSEHEPLERAQVEAPRTWQDLLAGRAERVAVGSAEADLAPGAKAVFPGAFNPLHAGHRRMADVAQKLLGHPVEYELSVINVDKPALDYIEIDRRTQQFDSAERIWLTRAPTFVEKARLFRGPTFVVGADTIVRIAEARYYGGSASAAAAAIEELVASGCRFLVFGRTIEGRFCTLAELNLPEKLTHICQEVPAETFREEVSSTELRRANGG